MTQDTLLPCQPIALSKRQTLFLPALLSSAPLSAVAQADAVDLLLVLAIDASGSIDAGEFRGRSMQQNHLKRSPDMQPYV